MTTNNLNGITDILQVFMPSRAFRRQMKNARCTLCGLGIVAVDIALMEVELGGVRTDTRLIHKQCSALVWDLLDELRGNEEGHDRDGESEGVDDPTDAE